MPATVKSVDEIHVYTNDDGYIVIQQTDFFGEDIHLIVFDTIHVEKLVSAIRKAKKDVIDSEKTGGV